MDPLTPPGRDFWHGVLAAGGTTTVPRWTLDAVPGAADHETPIATPNRLAGNQRPSKVELNTPESDALPKPITTPRPR